MIGIYVHIPFCLSKCIYCAFASFANLFGEQERYFNHLCAEIDKCDFTDREVKSVYFGGGTPSSVDEKYIALVMQKLSANFKILDGAEMTIECNPCSATEEKLSFYKHLGFNRISFGVQSLDDKTLKFLGRRHDKKMALKAIANAKSAGFTNISADLLLGIPNTNVVRDARTLIQNGVKHISAYMLQIEKGTPLEKMINLGSAKLLSDDETVDNYQKLAKFLQKNGLKRYEVSNFALEGFQSEHNKGYWNGSAYLGFGLGAHSFDGVNLRTANASNFKDYYAGKIVSERLNKSERDEEIIMLGLRNSMGFDKNKLSFDITKRPEFSKFLQEGILLLEGNIVRLNEDYYGVSNLIIEKLI